MGWAVYEIIINELIDTEQQAAEGNYLVFVVYAGL